ncbi:Uncharacterized conserved protein YbjT, contains NAD(P)-binding and DUF2867 domains [Ligilactobacillus sp. WC1T17]|uniref:Uncharacterized conserved protein YbjT, contains NAD(P)-binding and DUF2867 domains n=1 Tax=Ligilactobacillus ruminis TaxID=1623 RepID=A0ABY1ACQ6_9LACO|nr:Uncharacterized conserved protein YbjT, contains NAD(P)-binding and DUF2867 domains [Ligilactobacillus ruminis]
MKYLVTGATGHLGAQIVAALSQYIAKTDILAGVHTLSKAQKLKEDGYPLVSIEFNSEDSLLKAFQQADILIYVPSKSHTSFSRVQELERVVTAAQKAKIKHFLAMGFIADQVNNPFDLSAFYGYLPRRLAESSLPYTIIRNALYADPLVPYLPELIERQNVIYPVNQEALTFISLADSAQAFAKVAVTESLRLDGKIYTLTQDRNYTMPQLAEILSQVSGHKIGYQPVSLTEFGALYDENGEGHMLSSMYAGGALGLLDEVSDDFEKIMGHKEPSLLTFMEENYAK